MTQKRQLWCMQG